MEQILVVPTSLFHECGLFQGFSDQTDRYLQRLLDPEVIAYRPRDEMESDPSFKQLIPYCVFRHQSPDQGTLVFQYSRGSGQGESRLHSKHSIGIGGHISDVDDDGGTGDDGDRTYDRGMQREIEEEVSINTTFKQSCVGLINDDSNEVGKVHLGVVHLFDVDAPEVHANEPDIVGGRFVPVQSLLENLDVFETWSQICIEALFSSQDA